MLDPIWDAFGKAVTSLAVSMVARAMKGFASWIAAGLKRLGARRAPREIESSRLWAYAEYAALGNSYRAAERFPGNSGANAI